MGDTAKFQVRMPFGYATALVAVGARASSKPGWWLRGDDPTVELNHPATGAQRLRQRAGLARAPARGALVQLFTWGFWRPRDWWAPSGTARRIRPHRAGGFCPKPAFRLGRGRNPRRHRGPPDRREGQADQESYPVRGKAQVTVITPLPTASPPPAEWRRSRRVDQACWS